MNKLQTLIKKIDRSAATNFLNKSIVLEEEVDLRAALTEAAYLLQESQVLFEKILRD